MAEASAAERREAGSPRDARGSRDAGGPRGAGGPREAEGGTYLGAGGAVHRVDDDGVATLTLERGKYNALNGPYADVLASAIDACASDPAVRVVVLTGSGRYFCVGADLSLGPESIRTQLAEDRAAEAGDGAVGYREPAGRAVMAIGRLGKPLIAAVNGDAVGGGATISLAADLRFAAATARFSFPFTRLGVCPEGASTYYLPRLVGLGRATDWLLSGRLVDAAEAERTGLVNRVLAAGEVLAAAQAYARELVTTTSPAAVGVTRALLASAPGTPAEASDAESREISMLAERPDCVEGVRAFQQRRPPRFPATS